MKVTKDSFNQIKMKFINKNPIETINDYLEYVEYFQKRWGQNELWFRGISHNEYDLIPSIYRQEV